MALVTLSHKRLAGVVPASAAINDVLDAIATALAASTYYDGSARTAGSGSAWTATKEISGVTVALRLHPPTGSPWTGGAGVIAGVSAGAPTPQFIGNETFAVNELYGGVFRNVPGSPTWNGWDNATPYTGADFTGYGQMVNCATDSVDEIIVIESDETLWVLFYDDTTDFHWCGIGALVDPLSSLLAETSGRIHCVTTSGVSPASQTAHAVFTGGVSCPFFHSDTNNQAKCVTLDPQQSGSVNRTILPIQVSASSTPTTQLYKTDDFIYIGQAIWLIYDGTSGPLCGRAREIYRFSDTHGAPIYLDNTGADAAYLFAMDRAVICDTYGLKA